MDAYGWIRSVGLRISPACAPPHGDDGRLHNTITRQLPMREQTITATGTEGGSCTPTSTLWWSTAVEQMRNGGEARFDAVFVRA
jgi:hypothetical protein